MGRRSRLGKGVGGLGGRREGRGEVVVGGRDGLVAVEERIGSPDWAWEGGPHRS